MIQLKSDQSIQMSGNQIYPGFTYDKERLYFTTRDRHISVMQESGVFERTIYARRLYSNICYDEERRCFWAISPNNYGTIFQLSRDFQERNYMRFRIRNARPGYIQDICFDHVRNQFILVIASNIYISNFDGICQPFVVEEQLQDSCIACGCAGEYLFCCMVQSEERYSLMVVSRTTGRLVEEVVLAEGNQPLSVVAFEEQQEDLFRIKIYGCNMDNDAFVLDCEYKEIQESTETEEACQDQSYCGPSLSVEYEEHQEEATRELETIYENLLSDLSGNQGTESSCGNCVEPCQHACCPNDCQEICDRKKCEHICLEILESIACVEASIACVLNAEGEKLQRALKCSHSIKELLCINESIQKTIIHSTHLEQLLYSKMEMVFEKCLNK